MRGTWQTTGGGGGAGAAAGVVAIVFAAALAYELISGLLSLLAAIMPYLIAGLVVVVVSSIALLWKLAGPATRGAQAPPWESIADRRADRHLAAPDRAPVGHQEQPQAVHNHIHIELAGATPEAAVAAIRELREGTGQ